MNSAANRIGLFGEWSCQVSRHDRVHQRLQVPRDHCRPSASSQPREFLGQLQQPGPAISPLEGLVVRLCEVVGLDMEVPLAVKCFARTPRNLLTLRAGRGTIA